MKFEHIIFDFDSTLVGVEGIDVLAEVALSKSKRRDVILASIKKLTADAMSGKIAFDLALQKRISYLETDSEMIAQAAAVVFQNISPSVIKNVDFFATNSKRILIVSGGFEELIWPVADKLGIPREQVYANKFIYKGTKIAGVDMSRWTSKAKGKYQLLKSLELKGKIAVVGDGITDIEMKEYAPEHVTTFAYTEHIARPEVIKGADHVVKSVKDLIGHVQTSVLLCEHINDCARKLFEAEGYRVKSLDYAPDEHELMLLIADIDILGIRSRTHITQAIIDAAPHLSHILAYCVGTDQIDFATCERKHIHISHVQYASSRSVAEIVVGSIISLARRLPTAIVSAQKGAWNKSATQSHEVRGMTLGIVGYGTIGIQVGAIAEAIGMKVLAYDLRERPTQGHVELCETLEELLSKSNFVTLHVDGRQENRDLINTKEIAQMKRGSYLLNYSRGLVVNINALDVALKCGKIAGAALDVYPDEPTKNGAFDFPFAQYDNVILTPHIGGSTEEAQSRIAQEVTSRCIRYMKE